MNTVKLANSDIGRVVKKALIDQNITQKELAKRSGIAYKSLNRAINGGRSGNKYWPKILSCLGLEISSKGA